jgi:hypothetical protein
MEKMDILKEPKVFCIGFHKTGTTTMGKALAILGYKVAAQFGVNDPDISLKALPMANRIASQFDAFEDNPWPILFKEMDKNFPGSKFILTIRESELWYKSQCKHFGRRETPMRKWIYGKGCPEGNANIYLRRYARHNAEVAAHFKNRRNDLLVLRIGRNAGWDKLCSFLDIKAPSIAFPHENRAEERDKGN